MSHEKPTQVDIYVARSVGPAVLACISIMAAFGFMALVLGIWYGNVELIVRGALVAVALLVVGLHLRHLNRITGKSSRQMLEDYDQYVRDMEQRRKEASK